MHTVDKDERGDTKIYLHMDNSEDYDGSVDIVKVAENMAKKKKIYKYIFPLAVCIGVFLGLAAVGADYAAGANSCARAVISFQFEGIEEGLDPKGAAFDINKLKSPAIIDSALSTLNITEYTSEQIREKIVIEGVIPRDAAERIAAIKEAALKDVSNYERILDVSYYPSQYVVYLYKDSGMSGTDAVNILNAVLESYRTYFANTYANTDVLTITGNLTDYKDYDYALAVDLLETQIEIMKNYVSERKEQAPEFRSLATGLSFGDISAVLDTVSNTDMADLSSYIESHTLTKDRSRQLEYYEYRVKKYAIDISEYQAQLSDIQTVIDQYQKDPVVIMGAQENMYQYEQKNEYYNQLLTQKLELSAKIAELNTGLNEANALLNAANAAEGKNTQDEYSYADEKMSAIVETIAKWAEVTEQTSEEYYATSFLSNAYKVGVPAQYIAAGGLMAIVKKIAIAVAATVFAAIMVWCVDGLISEIRQMRMIKDEK